MIVLDTNVLSAVMPPTRDAAVVAWLDRQPARAVWTTAVTVIEIRTGIELLPEGRRRRLLEEEFARALDIDLDGRVLPFDTAAAQIAGELSARRRRGGFTDDVRDIQIAAIALARNASVATRNVRHFAGLGLQVVNPWEAP